MGKKDITQKSFFENAVFFADLMNAAYFGGDEILEAKDLLPQDGSLQRAEEGGIYERLRDVVKKQTKDGSIFALYVLENQTMVDYSMVIRIMVEESMAYHKQVKDIRKRNKERFGNALESDEYLCGFRRNDRLYPVYTLVLYWGEKEWDAQDSLQELMDMPVSNVRMERKLKEMLPDYRIHVYDLNKVKDFSAFKTSLRTLFEFYGCRKDGKKLKHYLEQHGREINNLDRDSKFLLSTMIDETRLAKKMLKSMEGETNKEEGTMCQAIQELIDEGRGEGKIEGKIESILELLLDIGEISNSLSDKISAETDEDVLRRWLKLAGKSNDIKEFEKAM